MNGRWKGVIAIISFLLLFYFSSKSYGEEELKVPPPSEIRNFEAKPNRLMLVEYANERVYLFSIEEIIPRSDCNQIKVDENNQVRLTTQSTEQTHEYVLSPLPLMVSEWVRY